MSLQHLFCFSFFFLLLTFPFSPQPESPPLSKSRSLHQVLERGDLSEVNSHKNSKSRLSEGSRGSGAPGPPPSSHKARCGAGAREPTSTRPKPASCAPERVLASPRLSQTTVAALKKLLRLQHSCWGDRPHTGHSLIRGGGLAEGGSHSGWDQRKAPPSPFPSPGVKIGGFLYIFPSLLRAAASP